MDLFYHRSNRQFFTKFCDRVENDSRIEFQMKPGLEEGNVIIFDSIHFKQLFYELYSFIIITKIIFDKINYFMRPLFKNSIGKSITAIVEKNKQTDCPLYLEIKKDSIKSDMLYLINFRDYLIHYKPFISTTSGYVIKEGTDLDSEARKIMEPWIINPLSFHFSINNITKFNIYVPDQFFEGVNTVKAFEYNKKYNILSFIRDMIEISFYIYDGVKFHLENFNPKTFSIK